MTLNASGISAALGSIKTIYDLLKGANDAQLALKIGAEVAAIQGQLIDVQQQSLEIQEENRSLRAEVDRFKSFIHHHSVMWRTRQDGTEDGPFCPPCHGEGREMRLILWEVADQSRDYWLVYCPKGHVDPREKAHGWTPRKQEPAYRVPKSLVPTGYFFHLRATNPGSTESLSVGSE